MQHVDLCTVHTVQESLLKYERVPSTAAGLHNSLDISVVPYCAAQYSAVEVFMINWFVNAEERERKIYHSLSAIGGKKGGILLWKGKRREPRNWKKDKRFISQNRPFSIEGRNDRNNVIKQEIGREVPRRENLFLAREKKTRSWIIIT